MLRSSSVSAMPRSADVCGVYATLAEASDGAALRLYHSIAYSASLCDKRDNKKISMSSLVSAHHYNAPARQREDSTTIMILVFYLLLVT